MKKTLLERAETNFHTITLINNKEEVWDSVIVNAHQMVELSIKALLKKKFGDYPKTHNLNKLLRESNESDLYKKYYNLAISLTELYFELVDEQEDEQIIGESLCSEELDSKQYYATVYDAISLYSDIKKLIDNK